MSLAKAICEEFSESVVVSRKVAEGVLWQHKEVDEVKCRVEIDYFTALVERMVEAGYCCTQVQKDLRHDLCTVWFEPRRDI